MDRKCIVFLLEDFSFGGVQRHTADLASRLAEHHKVVLLAIGKGAKGGPMANVPKCEVRELASGPVSSVRNLRSLGQIVKSYEPDILFTTNQSASLVGTAARLLAGISTRHCAIFHTTDVTGLRGWIRTLLFIPTTWLSHGLIFVSRNQAAIWKRRLLVSRLTRTIVNGVDTNRFRPPTLEERHILRAKLGFTARDKVVGICAAFRPEKNHRQLVHSVARLRSRIPGLKLLLLGDGPLRKSIEDLVSSLSLNDITTFAGAQSDVRPYLATMDAGVICSYAVETLSLAALESMAMEVPMIMSITGGASEIVDHQKNGWLFKVGSDSALDEGIEFCVADANAPALRRSAREKAVDSFDYDMMVKQYKGYIVEILA